MMMRSISKALPCYGGTGYVIILRGNVSLTAKKNATR